MTHPVDVKVGENLRRVRKLRGLSQGELGERIGVTFQQMQKYEKGDNRVSASKLWEAMRALDVPLGEFYAGLSIDAGELPPGPHEELAKLSEGMTPAKRRLLLKLARELAGDD